MNNLINIKSLSDKNINNPDNAYGFDDSSTSYTIRKMILSRTNKKGLTKVFIEVRKHTYNGTGQYEDTFKRVSTNVWIEPKNWSQSKEKINDNEPEAEFKTNEINKYSAAVQKYISSKGQQYPNQAYGEKLNINTLSEFFPSRQENRKNLIDYIDEYIQFRKDHNTKYTTLKEFTTMKNRVEAFDKNRGKKTYFEDLDVIWSDEFELFLLNKAENGTKLGYNIGTIEKTYCILITVLNHFYNRRKQLQIGLTDDFRIKSTSSTNGFKRGKKSINDANPLTKEQLDTLYYYKFDEPYLQNTKDRFLWQCFTGIRFVDAFTINREHIKNNWLRFKPSKTINHNVRVEQPLNKYAIEILEKYDYDMRKLDITNQVYNRYLKDMFGILIKKYPKLNYQKDFGTYASRDTFISMCVNSGVNWDNILKWVGQSSYAIMKRYVKIEDKHQEVSVKNVFNIPEIKPENNPDKKQIIFLAI